MNKIFEYQSGKFITHYYIENSCVAYEKVENKKGLEAFKYMNDLGISLYFYYKDDKGSYKYYDDYDRFIRDINR